MKWWSMPCKTPTEKEARARAKEAAEKPPLTSEYFTLRDKIRDVTFDDGRRALIRRGITYFYRNDAEKEIQKYLAEAEAGLPHAPRNLRYERRGEIIVAVGAVTKTEFKLLWDNPRLLSVSLRAADSTERELIKRQTPAAGIKLPGEVEKP